MQFQVAAIPSLGILTFGIFSLVHADIRNWQNVDRNSKQHLNKHAFFDMPLHSLMPKRARLELLTRRSHVVGDSLQRSISPLPKSYLPFGRSLQRTPPASAKCPRWSRCHRPSCGDGVLRSSRRCLLGTSGHRLCGAKICCQVAWKPSGRRRVCVARNLVLKDSSAVKSDDKITALGCDGIPGSTKKYDICRVCGGDNTTCEHVQETLYIHVPIIATGTVYTEIFQLPVGATYFRIEDQSQNFLAIQSHNGTFLLNGDGLVNWPGSIQAAGSSIHYARMFPEGRVEAIWGLGPTEQVLHMMVLYRGDNESITYEYWKKRDPRMVHKSQSAETIIQLSPGSSFPGVTTQHILGRGVQRDATMDDTKTGAEAIDSQMTTSKHMYDDMITTHIPASKVPRITEDLNTAGAPNDIQQDQAALATALASTSVEDKANETTKAKPISRKENTQKKNMQKYMTTPVAVPEFCRICKKVRDRNKQYCQSAFVIGARVSRWKSIGREIRYDVTIDTIYKGNIPLVRHEYIWLPYQCRCPRMRRGERYVIMGRTSSGSSSKEIRLEIDFTSYVRKWSERLEQRIRKFENKQQCSASRYKPSSEYEQMKANGGIHF